MKYTKINITNNTVIEAYGTHTNGNRKGVYVVEMKKAFVSMTDAAEEIGCSVDGISNVIRGKQKTCKGYHIIELSKMGEAFPQLMEYTSHIPTPKAKAKSEIDRKKLAEIRAKARAYDKLMAEKEAKRKAEEREQKRREKHETKKAKLMFEIDKHKSKAEKFYAKYEAHTRMQMRAEQKFEALMDKEVL